jgi:hypothetical protein
MSRLNVASWGLLIGALGQCVLYSSLFQHLPPWFVLIPLLPPWLTVYIISFCRLAPCGPQRFRQFLLFAMCWYAAMSLIADAMTVLFHPVPREHFSIALGRVLMYAGGLTFIVFIRALIQIGRQTQSNGTSGRQELT